MGRPLYTPALAMPWYTSLQLQVVVTVNVRVLVPLLSVVVAPSGSPGVPAVALLLIHRRGPGQAGEDAGGLQVVE
jgi:hypothetical protein